MPDAGNPTMQPARLQSKENRHKKPLPGYHGKRLLLKGKLLFPAPEDCPLAGIRGKLAVTAQPGGGNPV
ncbi:hypothetical protein LIP81_20595, partial [Erysipelatoclostridium ramosum]|nr:hypothetical protein [Thomasclavelia ramosa]